MPKTPPPPSYTDLIAELRRAIECIGEASANLALPGRARRRLILCATRIRLVVERADGDAAEQS